MDAIKTIDFSDGHKLEIYHDEDPQSPRLDDNLGTFVAFHKRYNLGDKDHGIDNEAFNTWDELEQHLRDEHDATIILPVYMIDHSGLAFSTTPFSCPWDSGQIGFIFISKAKLIKEYGNDSDETRQRVHTYLNGEIETYNQFSTGDIYGFIFRGPNCETCDGEGENLDSCWGFYGDDPSENGMADNLDKKYQEELAAFSS